MAERLISADALRKSMAEWYDGVQAFTGADIIDVIDNAPTVDAVPIVHGRWIIRDNPGTGWYRITCSECGEDVTATAPCIGFFPNAKVSWDYCPACGARMDGEE